MATPKTTINIHPKVFTGLLIGLGVAAVTGIAGAVSPDLFASLGVWGAPAFSLATTGLAVLGAWLKRVQTDEQKAAVKSAKAAVKSAVVDVPEEVAAAVIDVSAFPAEPAPEVLPAVAIPSASATQSSVIG